MDEIVGCGVVVDLDVGKSASLVLIYKPKSKIKIPKYRVNEFRNGNGKNYEKKIAC